MRSILWIVGVVVLWPSAAVGEFCSEFPWQYPRDMVMPILIANGQITAEEGSLLEAREYYSTYLLEQPEGVFAEGAEWAVAALPDALDEPGKEFLKQIQRLQAIKAKHPDSVYAPWALCSMGQLYWDAGWHSEGNALFEEFLEVYPDHPLAGGVMVETGLGFLKNQQFLEAALILRRVVEEPKWEAHRLKGALGLAQATAMSKAWKQAYYWYRVVEAENPELLQRSEGSSYYYGLTELAVGNPDNAIPQFLNAVNFHPKQEFAGQALIRISEQLLKEGHDFLSLWFAEEAKRRFKGKEFGRRGQAAQTRWIVNYLAKEHSKEEWENVYKRMNDVEVYLSVSWDNVLETARALSRAPEPDLVEESLLWMGRGYHMDQDIPEAIQSFKRLAIVANSQASRKIAQKGLSTLLNKKIQSLYDKRDWVRLLKFHEDQKEEFQLIPLTREHVKIVAQAYQQVSLPSKAMQWYDELLQENPESHLREEIFAQKVFLAEDQAQGQLVRDAGMKYVKEYPQGQWRAEVSTALGMESLARKDYPDAIQELSHVVSQTHNKGLQRYVLRHRARAYQELGKRDLALLDLRQVVALDPMDMANVIRLGDFLFDQGDFEDAGFLYDKILASEAPVALNAWAKYRWGLSLEYQGNATEAQKRLAEVRQLETKAPEFENTIRAVAVAVLDEFSLKEQSQVRRKNEGS